jgi:hypothetical protein
LPKRGHPSPSSRGRPRPAALEGHPRASEPSATFAQAVRTLLGRARMRSRIRREEPERTSVPTRKRRTFHETTGRRRGTACCHP